MIVAASVELATIKPTGYQACVTVSFRREQGAAILPP